MVRLRRKHYRDLLVLGLILTALVLGLMVMPEGIKYIGKAKGVGANITVDAEAVLGDMPKPWRNLAQGGEESDLMLDDVTEQMKALRPEYVRIDHIYDMYGVVSKNGGQLTYDWSRLDRAVETITATGAKPMLSLSYMPTAISRGDITDLPKDWQEWQQMVKATVEHYSGRGNRNISGVIYEVWNEPDLFGNFKTYGDKNYLTLYKQAVLGASSARGVNGFKIGGPATTGLYKNWLDSFLDFCQQNNLRLDFYSWHRYSTNLEQYEKDVQQIETWLQQHPEMANLELYITEWGHNSELDAGYDGSFGAIQTIAAARVMMSRVDRAFVFEIKDGPGNEKYWGRWGLLTHEKFGQPTAKPRYFALQLLNSLGDERVSLSGEGTWVRGIAAKKGSTIQVLLVNYDPSGKHTEAVPIKFENLPAGTFNYKRSDFLGSSRTQQITTMGREWTTTEYMKANNALMLELSF